MKINSLLAAMIIIGWYASGCCMEASIPDNSVIIAELTAHIVNHNLEAFTSSLRNTNLTTDNLIVLHAQNKEIMKALAIQNKHHPLKRVILTKFSVKYRQREAQIRSHRGIESCLNGLLIRLRTNSENSPHCNLRES